MDNSKKPPLPSSLGKLPRYSITSTPAFSRTDHERADIAFGVKTMKDLMTKLKEGFAEKPTKK
jgi:hypothetical protein